MAVKKLKHSLVYYEVGILLFIIKILVNIGQSHTHQQKGFAEEYMKEVPLK